MELALSSAHSDKKAKQTLCTVTTTQKNVIKKQTSNNKIPTKNGQVQ